MTVARDVAIVIATIVKMDSKLDQIHLLVNSNLTAANRSELAALESKVRLSKEIIGLKRAGGMEVTAEIFDDIDASQARIYELQTILKNKVAS